MWHNVTLREKVILGLLAALLVAGGVWRALPRGQPAELARIDRPEPGEEAEPELVTVHLVGAVHLPGVYRLPAGSRVHELIEAAGGAAEDADLVQVNLARPLFDGEQVHIPRQGEASVQQPGSNKININQAPAEELAALPGIGPVRAQRIVEHREKHGYFTDITEIMDVTGIGEGIFNSIEELIAIY